MDAGGRSAPSGSADQIWATMIQALSKDQLRQVKALVDSLLGENAKSEELHLDEEDLNFFRPPTPTDNHGFQSLSDTTGALPSSSSSHSDRMEQEGIGENLPRQKDSYEVLVWTRKRIYLSFRTNNIENSQYKLVQWYIYQYTDRQPDIPEKSNRHYIRCEYAYKHIYLGFIIQVGDQQYDLFWPQRIRFGTAHSRPDGKKKSVLYIHTEQLVPATRGAAMPPTLTTNNDDDSNCDPAGNETDDDEHSTSEESDDPNSPEPRELTHSPPKTLSTSSTSIHSSQQTNPEEEKGNQKTAGEEKAVNTEEIYEKETHEQTPKDTQKNREGGETMAKKETSEEEPTSEKGNRKEDKTTKATSQEKRDREEKTKTIKGKEKDNQTENKGRTTGVTEGVNLVCEEEDGISESDMEAGFTETYKSWRQRLESKLGPLLKKALDVQKTLLEIEFEEQLKNRVTTGTASPSVPFTTPKGMAGIDVVRPDPKYSSFIEE